MPRTVTRPGPPSLLLGVWGQGKTDAENISALLKDFIDGQGERTVKVLVPLDKDLSSDTIQTVAAVAAASDWEVEVIQTAAPRVKNLREIKETATKTHESSPETIEADFVALLAGAKDARLLFLWAEDDNDEPDEDDQRLLAAVSDAGVVCLDLTQGLDVLETDPAEEEPEEEPAVEEDAPKKAAPKEAKAAADPAPESDADDPTEEEIKGWAERRVRSYAIRCGLEEAEAVDMKKPALLEWLLNDPDAAAEEPEPEAADAPVRPAKEIRKEIEAEKADKPARGRAAAKEEEPAAEVPDEAQTEVYVALTPRESSAAEAFGNLVADLIIERLAARLESEPEKSPLREEIAPSRPPGRPRTDGSAPTRRRTAK